MITITLCRQKLTAKQAVNGSPMPDRATATWDGHTFEASSAHGATMSLARKLVAAGCPDQSWEARTSEGQRTVFGTSLHALAMTTISERTGRPTFRPFVERPDFVPGKGQEAGRAASRSYWCGERLNAAGTPTLRNQKGSVPP